MSNETITELLDGTDWDEDVELHLPYHWHEQSRVEAEQAGEHPRFEFRTWPEEPAVGTTIDLIIRQRG